MEMEKDQDQDQDQDIGEFLRQLRLTAGEAARRSGVSNPYLSQVERGIRRPGPNILKLLAPVYGASMRDLMERAGFLEEVSAPAQLGETNEVERAYQFVLSDPRFRFGTRPQGQLTPQAKRFIVEMYEKLTGKRLL